MKRLFKYIKEKFNKILRLILFFLTTLIIVNFLPREGKFQYEFTEGDFWKHDVLLIAPFDFSIYKTDQEIQAEKDSVIKLVKPYFYYDTNVYWNQKLLFNEEIENRWTDFIIKNYTVTDISQIKSPSKRNALLKIKEKLKEYISILIKNVYDRGVIETFYFEEEVNDPNFQIKVFRDVSEKDRNIAKEYNIMEVNTPKRAYEYLIKKTNELEIKWEKNKNFDVAGFVRNLNLNSFIVPNLIYDKETTEKVKSELCKNISPTRGKVKQGERIIAKGEPVTGETYNILESLKKEYEKRLGKSSHHYLVLIGNFVLAFFSVFLLYMFLHHYRKNILASTLHVTFIIFIVLLMVFLAKLALSYSEIVFLFVPFALLPILIRTFFDARLALFVHVITILLIGFIAPNGFEFVFMNVLTGMVAVISLTYIHRRSRIVFTGFYIIVTYSLIYMGMNVIHGGSFNTIVWENIAWFSMNGLLVLLAYPLIYVFEKMFKFLSDTTLIELSDTNQPLLRKLAEEAPGTFQHSMQVANLAEGAIVEIGGNPLLVRAGALYHDIGKMDKPEYYIENLGGDYNPHKYLDFKESAEIIISHVEKGIERAKKYNLPYQIVDFVRTHHGTSTVQYFYRSFLKEFPNEEVDIKKFSYPGPKPYSKETAVLMMADAVEAASRSLKSITEESIGELVEEIINYQIKEKQIDNAPLTFRDITTIKSIFKNKLKNIYHARIEYPKE